MIRLCVDAVIGAWARERYIKERTLEQGITALTAGAGEFSHEHNPFMILRRQTYE